MSERDYELAPHGNTNPFGMVQRQSQNNAIADSRSQREIAEVQAAMVIAKRFPRDQIMAMDRITQACTRQTLAEVAMYSYSRGGSEITGPSIRMAEVLAQSWGNMDFGIRELDQRDGESTIEAYAWDIETNTRQTKTFQVPHERHTRQGVKKLSDPRDIYELVANQGARRLRACILGIIPGDVQEAAIRQCEETLRANADTTPDGLKKILAAFAPFEVKQAHIEKRIQCRLEAIRPAQVVHLRKVLMSLKDGMSAPGDWFEIEPVAAGGGAPVAVSDVLGNGKAKATKEAQPAPAEPVEKSADKPAENPPTQAPAVDPPNPITGDPVIPSGHPDAPPPPTTGKGSKPLFG